MRRYLAIAFPILVVLVLSHAIGYAGRPRLAEAKPSSPKLLPSAEQIMTPSSQTTAVPEAMPTVSALSAQCHWHQYPDGAIGSDPDCAPGVVDAAVRGHTAQTICSPGWLATTTKVKPSVASLDQLLIKYQLPGNPVTYVAAQVIPVEDGGSPTGPANLYPLPLNGYGGQRTRMLVADELHREICASKITVAQSAKLLEGDWLADGFPDDD